MKKFLLTILFIGMIFPVFSENWATEKSKEFGAEKNVKEGNFGLAVGLFTEELLISEGYEEWVQKRYSKTKMVEEAKKELQEFDNAMMAILVIHFTGNILSEGKTSIDIPTDFHEYIFAENERGEYLRCTDTDNISWLRSVDVFNESEIIILTFSKLTDDGKDIIEGASELIFVIEGLGFEQNRISYSLPLSDYFIDMPEEQREILIKAKEEINLATQ